MNAPNADFINPKLYGKLIGGLVGTKQVQPTMQSKGKIGELRKRLIDEKWGVPDVVRKLSAILNLSRRLERMQDTVNAKGFAFQENGKLARRICMSGFTLGEKQMQQVGDMVSGIGELYGNIVDRENVAGNPVKMPIFTRLDTVMNLDGDLFIAEAEPIYAGIGETIGMRDVYSELRGTNQCAPAQISSNYIGNVMTTMYANILAERFSGKTVLILPNPRLPGYYSESRYVYQQLCERMKSSSCVSLQYGEFNENGGIAIGDSSPASAEIKEDGLYINSQKIDCLLNFFVPKEDVPTGQFDIDILNLWRSGKIELYPQPTTVFGSKDMLADSNVLPPSLISRIPETFLFSQETTDTSGYFLKRSVSSVNKGDFYDGDGSIDREKILSDTVPWILQKKIDTKKFRVVSMGNNRDITQGDMYARIEVYIFFPSSGAALGDILVTMSPRAIVKGSRDGVMIPAITSYPIQKGKAS